MKILLPWKLFLQALMAAIAWNLLTWWFGIPSSSSHTLLGGFMGAALAHAGVFGENGIDVINYAKVIPTFLFIFLGTFNRNDHRIYYHRHYCKYLPKGKSI